MKEIKPNLPQWVDPGDVKHTFPPPNPKTIISREPPRAVLDRIIGLHRIKYETVQILEGTPEFNRGMRSGS